MPLWEGGGARPIFNKYINILVHTSSTCPGTYGRDRFGGSHIDYVTSFLKLEVVSEALGK